MAEFHFLRPLWLILLPAALWLAWRLGTGRSGSSGWRAVVDAALQPHVLREGEHLGRRRWPVVAALAAAAVAILALAGPTWERLPVPAYRTDESLVVALDLSRSMDAPDVAPTRLARARLKLIDLLERRAEGQTALVVFTSNAFTVTPLTTDTRTIGSLVGSLSTDIMPSQGSLLEVGIDKAAELLKQTGTSRGQILVITDATASPEAFELAETLASDGITTSVLAVGTEQGAPIPVARGGFLTDAAGQVVVPQLNAGNLERLALAGGGRFARLSSADADLDHLFPDESVGSIEAEGRDSEQQADVWRDGGIWLALALLPLVLLAFRRGWVYVLVVSSTLPMAEAGAFEWSDLWLRRDQQGVAALQRDAPGEAARLFEDPEWLAAARYRAGQYEESAAALTGIDTADAHYNRGNALARSGNLAAAIEAYDRALELAPGHADAEYNRELVAELLDQQPESPPESDSGDGQPEDGEQNQAETEANQQQAAEQGADDGDSSGEEQEQQAANRQADPQDQQGDGTESEQDREPGEPEDSASSDDESAARTAAVSPEEIEDWASEQAADQWLRRVPQDPGGLLRRKFLYQYQQLGVDQDGNRIYPNNAAEPW